MTIDWGNLSQPELIPTYVKKFHLATIDEYDNEWRPMFMRFMPKRRSPGLTSTSSGREFSMPWVADPQAMAKFHDARERVQMMAAPQMQAITHWHRTAKNGYAEDLEEFEGDFADGVISAKRKMFDRNIIRNINRLIEFTLSKYVYGDADVMGSFSTQGTARQAYANINRGTFRDAADDNLGGINWGNATAPIFSDLNYLKDRFELMAGDIPGFLVIGRCTNRSLEDNDDLLNRLIQIRDTTQGVLGQAIQGLTIVRVVGQTYKEVPGIDTDHEGYPGKGDYLRQTWDNLNKIEMMTELVQGNRWEWGLITNRELGFTSCAWTHKLHQEQRNSPTEFFVREWMEHDPLEVKNVAALTICPVTQDRANALILHRTCQQD